MLPLVQRLFLESDLRLLLTRFMLAGGRIRPPAAGLAAADRGSGLDQSRLRRDEAWQFASTGGCMHPAGGWRVV